MARMLPLLAWLALDLALASLAGAGSIAGRVAGPGDQPLEEVCVSVVDAADLNDFVGSDFTDALGNWHVEDLEAGSYKIYFSECLAVFHAPDGQPTHAPEWYADRPTFASADVIAVAENEDVTGIDADLAVGGSIRGEVTEEESGDPLEDSIVYVFEKDTDEFGYDFVDPDGGYEIRGLPAGQYYVLFDTFVNGLRRRLCENEPMRLTEIYDDVPYVDDFAVGQATLVPVALGAATPGIDAALGFAPPADLATSLTVTGGAPGSTDPRTIEVTVENLGGWLAVIPWLEVEVCGATVGCSPIGDENLSLIAGGSETHTFTWSPQSTLSVGDVEIRAHAWVRNDDDCTNNHAAHADSVHVTGTGAGVSLLREGALP